MSYDIDKIIEVVCDKFEIPVEKLYTKTRKTEVVQARTIIMFFIRDNGKTLQSTGAVFGLDHATVFHALARIQNYMTSPTFKETYNLCKAIKKPLVGAN